MRAYLNLSANTSQVPFNYQPFLVGALHKWLGNNNIHGSLSLYSFSWLKNGRKSGKTLDFRNGGLWHISFYDEDLMKKLIAGIRTDPEINFGMRVTEITLRNTPEFGEEETFMLDSPVLVKRIKEGEKNEKHYTFSDPEANGLLTETLRHKLTKAGLGDRKIEVIFDTDYSEAKTKMVTYRDINNRANMCPVILKGDPDAIAFAWNVGIGNSTGIGFGSVR